MQLSVPFSELCIDLSSANAAEAKGNYEGLWVCLPLWEAFLNHSGPKDPAELEKVICASPFIPALTGNVHSQGEQSGHTQRHLCSLVESSYLGSAVQKSREGFFAQTHIYVHILNFTTLSETLELHSLTQQTYIEGLLVWYHSK